MVVERVEDEAELEGLYRLNPDLAAIEEAVLKPPSVPVQRPDPGLVVLDRIVNLGERLWTLVERNRPVVGVEAEKASALPQGIEHWEQLGHWQRPEVETYRIGYVNFFGVQVAQFTMRILYTWGGDVDGIGRYLANITVIPAYIDVHWGFRFNALTEVADVVNVNDREFPIAAAEIHVRWSLESVFRKIHQSAIFFVKGNGEFEVLSGEER